MGGGIGPGQRRGARIRQRLNPDRADRIAAAIQAHGGQATAWQGDVGNKLLVGPMIEAMRDAFGKIDLVINAAGVEKKTPFLQMDEWDWRRQLEVNLNGAFFRDPVGRARDGRRGWRGHHPAGEQCRATHSPPPGRRLHHQ
ncbi:MAG: SDR family NAD(P)-dependent oxidoreductase [Anaerolineae bacterium]|nr:SDR family NAD(P)-dependent oxidoreductase [Anaerolineae bacterium]